MKKRAGRKVEKHRAEELEGLQESHLKPFAEKERPTEPNPTSSGT